jgi:GTPase SAR1 family protein
MDVNVIEEFSGKHGMIWLETSAKTGENINKLFEKVAQKVFKRQLINNLVN